MAKIVQFHEKGGPEVLKLEEVTLYRSLKMTSVSGFTPSA